MATEAPIQRYYIEVLKARQCPYIHFPNSLFRCKFKWIADLFRYLPDLFFLWRGRLCLREVGVNAKYADGKVTGNHSDQKNKQLEKMRLWKSHGADISIILSMAAAREDLENIGLL